MLKVALFSCVLGLAYGSLETGVETKHLKVDRLDRWKVLNEYSNIYDPTTLSDDGNGASHSVHVSDDRGKYLKLDYSMNHPSDAGFIKLESDEHSNNIKSVECSENSEMTLYFNDESTMKDYYTKVSFELSEESENNDYYIVGSHLWKCKDHRKQKYYPIMRRINSIETSESDSENNKYSITIDTSYATYLDVFENLNMEFETNIRLSHESMETYKSMVQGYKSSNGRNNAQSRRLLSWLSDVWDDIVDGVETVVDDVETVVETVVDDVEDLWDDVETVVDVLEGKNVTFSNSSGYSWSYNYDETNDNASSTFYLDSSDKVNCLNCYAYFDLVYKYQVEIYDRSLYRLYLVGEGDAKINVEIEMEVSFSYEYDIDTPDIPIPYLSVDVFGIDFGFVIYGEIGVGVYIEMDYIYVGASAYGSITRGIEYYGPYSSEGQGTTNGTMQYISDESFDHSLVGPKVEFSSANITFYLKPTIYLELTYVGSVYFGLQPEIELKLTKDAATNVSTDCAIDFTPTAKLLAFVGAQIDPLDLGTIWKKEISLTVVQFVLTTLEGCITEAELTTIETYIETLDDALTSRRRMSGTSDDDDDSFSSFYLDYTTVSTNRYDNTYRWGKTGTEWWGNLTTLNITGSAQDYLADDGKLLLKVRESRGNELIGVYVTQVDNWYLPPLTETDPGFYTNVTCVSRTQFKKLSNSTIDGNGVYSYFGDLLEYHCDVNDTYLFANDDELKTAFLKKITLSGEFYALMMDTHFHSGFLFDSDFNHLFALSQKRKHSNAANASFISAKPSLGWFGDYHCQNGSTVHVTCYFQSYDPLTGDVSAVLDLGSEHYWLYGTMSFIDNRLYLETQDSRHVSLSGYLTLYSDGTILYTGPALSTHDECTAFVLQGYLDTTELDSISDADVDDGGNKSPSIETIINNNKLETGMFYGALIMFGVIGILVTTVIVAMSCNGYKFCVKVDKANPAPNGYEMMDGQL